MSDELEKVRQDYRNTLPSKIGDIQKAADQIVHQLGRQENVPWMEFQNLVHKAAGSTGTYGYFSLSQLLRHMEECIESKELLGLEPKYASGHVQRWLKSVIELTQEVTQNGKGSSSSKQNLNQGHEVHPKVFELKKDLEYLKTLKKPKILKGRKIG